MTQTSYKLHKLIFDMTNADYHGTEGTYSSSQFKDLNNDEDLFIAKHVKKEIPRESNENFDLGSLFHTMTLEPHKAKEEFAVFKGKRRAGDLWEEFKSANEGKTILTMEQTSIAKRLRDAVKASPLSCKYLIGKPEVSLFIELNVHDGDIYAPYFGKQLTGDGWVDGPKKRLEGAMKVVVKVRADCLGKGFISDLKSTSGNAKSLDDVSDSVRRYQYDLSGALYLDLFSLMNPEIAEFILIFVSKKLFIAKAWALSADSIYIGRQKYMKALRTLALRTAQNWEDIDSMGVIDPHPQDLHWKQVRDTDFL